MKKLVSIILILFCCINSQAQNEISVNADEIFTLNIMGFYDNSQMQFNCQGAEIMDIMSDYTKIKLKYAEPGIYNFNITEIAESGCKKQSSFKINVGKKLEELPNEDETIYQTTIQEDETIVLRATGFFADSQLEFTAENADIKWLQSDFGKISLSYPTKGEYFVYITETTINGCSHTTKIKIIVTEKKTEIPEKPDNPQNPEEPENPEEPINPENPDDTTPEVPDNNEIKEITIYIPNIFTPNNDGINDCFHIKYDEKPSFMSIVIFSRNGKKVYTSNNPDFLWDGKDCNPDTYFYIIKYNNGIQIKTVTGFITMTK